MTIKQKTTNFLKFLPRKYSLEITHTKTNSRGPSDSLGVNMISYQVNILTDFRVGFPRISRVVKHISKMCKDFGLNPLIGVVIQKRDFSSLAQVFRQDHCQYQRIKIISSSRVTYELSEIMIPYLYVNENQFSKVSTREIR